MNRTKFMSLSLVVLLILFVGCDSNKLELHILTFNIRYANPEDGINRWENRIPIVDSYFSKEMPDIIGMQEVLHSQLIDLQEMLPNYSFIGTGRDDGKEGGEYSPLFFRTDKFNLLEHSQFWLTETPNVPGSRSWDAAITRIVAWAKLEHKPSGKVFFCFNTHFDHRGVEARKKSTDLMSEKIQKIAINYPVIAMGDFNIIKNDTNLGSALYYNLIGIFKENHSLVNSEYISKAPVTTSGATTNGFRQNWTIGEPGDAKDYIFVNDHFNVELYRVDRVMEGKVFISDHWPVVSIISFSN